MIWFPVRVFGEQLSICVCAYFPLDFESGVWDCISSYLLSLLSHWAQIR